MNTALSSPYFSALLGKSESEVVVWGQTSFLNRQRMRFAVSGRTHFVHTPAWTYIPVNHTDLMGVMCVNQTFNTIKETERQSRIACLHHDYKV